MYIVWARINVCIWILFNSNVHNGNAHQCLVRVWGICVYVWAHKFYPFVFWLCEENVTGLNKFLNIPHREIILLLFLTTASPSSSRYLDADALFMPSHTKSVVCATRLRWKDTICFLASFFFSRVSHWVSNISLQTGCTLAVVEFKWNVKWLSIVLESTSQKTNIKHTHTQIASSLHRPYHRKLTMKIFILEKKNIHLHKLVFTVDWVVHFSRIF